MPRTATVAPSTGVVKQTVTQESFIPAADAARGELVGINLFDFMETTTEAQWTDQKMIMYLYRNGESGPFLTKFVRPVTQEFIRDEAEVVSGGMTVGKGFGGGDYHYILKRGSERLKEGSFKLEGFPKRYDGTMPIAPIGGGGNTSELTTLVKMMLDEMRALRAAPANAGPKETAEIAKLQSEMVMSTFKTSQDLLSAQIAQLNAARGGSEMPDWLKQLLGAALPALGTAVVGIVTKTLEPKDALATLREVGAVIQTMKSMSGETATPDTGASIVTALANNGPAWLQGITGVIAQLNKAGEIAAINRAAATAQRPPLKNVTPPGAPRPQPQANAQPQPGGAAPQALPPFQVEFIPCGDAEFDEIARELCEFLVQGAGGDEAVQYFVQKGGKSAELMRGLATSKMQFEEFCQAVEGGAIHPTLPQLKAHPSYAAFMRQFYDAVMHQPAGVPGTGTAGGA